MQEKSSYTVQDVRAEEVLPAHLGLLRALSTCCSAGIFLADEAGGCTYTSSHFREILGLHADESAEQGWARLLYPEDRETLRDAWSAYLRGGSELDCELRVVTPQGGVRWIQMRSVPVCDERGLRSGHVGTIEDISASKGAEEVARQAEKTLRSMLDAVGDGFYALDREWRFTYVNEYAARLAGKTPEELVGTSIWEDGPAIAILGAREHVELRRAMSEQLPVCYESYVPAQDFWYEARAYPANKGLYVFLRDISEQRRSERALRESEQRMRLAQHAAKVGTWEWHVATKQVEWSEGVWALLGIEQGSVEPGFEVWVSFIHAEDRDRVLRNLESVFAQGEAFYDEFRLVRGDGMIHWLASIGRVIRNENGQVERMLGVNIDITERKQTEEALRASEERYRVLADALPHIVWDADAQGTSEYGNLRWLEYTSMSPEQTRNRGWLAAVHPDDAPRLVRDWEHALRMGERHEGWFRLRRHSDGAYRWFQSIAVPVRNGEGAILRWVGCAVDVDDELRAKIALRDSAEQLSLALAAAHMGGWSWHAANDMVSMSERAAEIIGIGAEQAVPWSRVRDLLSAEDRERNRLAFERAVAEHTDYDVEYRIAGPDNAHRWIAIKGRAQYDVAGRILGMYGVVQDVTEHKRAEDSLRESERRYRSIFESAPVSICEEDFSATKALIDELKAHGVRDMRAYLEQHPEVVVEAMQRVKLVDVNPAALALFRARSKAEVLATLDVIFVPETMPVFREELIAIAEGRRTFASETQLATVNGERLDVLFSMAFPGPDEPFDSVLVCLMDIRERKHAEQEREQLLAREQAARKEAEHAQQLSAELLVREEAARAQAEAASRTKDEFLAVLSHELRTPLNAIVGWASMLLTSRLDEATTARALQVIQRNAKAQAQLIEDLLDISRIVSGKLSIDIQLVDVASVARAAVDVVRPAASAKEIDIELALDPATGPVYGDPDRLQQIVWNLLSNAVKFTPRRGRIQLALARAGSHVELAVSDTGRGISADFLPYVFERFRQADSTITRAHGGLGLGLAIVRHLVELHGGMVLAESDGEGHGATFVVRLPLAAVVMPEQRADASEPGSAGPAAAQHLACPPVLAGRRVLVVEDERDAREMLAIVLGQCNAQVRAVDSVAAGLAVFQAWQPELVISDIEMPGEDGYSLIRKIRALEAAPPNHVPAIALTAHAREADRMRALAAGFDAHLAKPVAIEALLDILAQLV